MKVILTGVTGFIGKEVLKQAIKHPSITSISCVTRRAIPEEHKNNPKVKEIIHEDLSSWPDSLISQLEGAEACIWSLGLPAGKPGGLEVRRKVEVATCHAAAQAFCKTLAPPLRAKGQKFRFVYLSGMFAARDTNQKLLLMHDIRVAKGEVENGLLELEKNEENNLQVTIARPGGVLGTSVPLPDFLVAATASIKSDTLAAALVEEAVGKNKKSSTLECAELRRIGGDALRRLN
ncbi:hypothetical protein F5884DRAFT_328370 [Xylogone sp. PMI_703]|nr:hypothetical protein F5884DRAFT_328370 [Xylogone sp. PMI_703]